MGLLRRRSVPVESVKLLKALEAKDFQVVAQLTPAALAPNSTPVDAVGLADLERYTLFSSFLL